MNIKKYTLGLTLFRVIRYISAILIIISIWFLWPSELDRGMVRQENTEVSVDVPDYLMRKLRYVSVKNSRQSMELFASTATFHMKQEVLYGKEIDAYFFNEQGRKTRILGDTGTYSMKDQQLLVEGNIRSVSPDGFKLKTEVATFDAVKRVLEAKVPVEGESEDEGLWMRGDSARAPIDSNMVFFHGNAKAKYNDVRYGDTVVRGDRSRLNREENKVVFEKNVVIDQKDMNVTSDEASIYYLRGGGNEDKLNYMQAIRNVVIRQSQNRYSRSQLAEFFADSDTVVLTGFPSIYDGKDTITGDKLTLYRSSGVVEVKSANAAFRDGPDLMDRPDSHRGSTKKNQLNEVDKELILEE